MANEVKIKAVLDDKVSRPLNDIRKAMDKGLGKGSSASFFGNVGAKAVSKGFDLIGSAASGAIDMVGDMVQASSNLAEETSKSNVIFGQNAAAIQDWAEGGAKAFGLSERAALEAASGFAGLFSTVGVGIDDATDMAKKITVMGSDLASFFNTDMATALDALKSGLSGESEPLRRFNVFLSETAVSAKLSEMGIKKVNGQFTEGQKVTARYALILDQTSAAQGDFIRTADGLANAQRTVNAQLENTQAQLGKEFLPTQLAVTQAQLDFFEGLGVVADGLGELDKAVADTQRGVHDFLTFWEDDQALRNAQDELDKTTARMAYMADAGKDDLVVVADATKDIGVKADEAAKAFDAAMDKIVGSVADAREDLEKAGTDAANATFDPLLAKAELVNVELDIKRQRNLRDAAKAGSKERTEAQNNLLALEKTKVEILTTLASTGDKSATISLEAMARTHLANVNLSAEARAYWNNVLITLRQVEITAKRLAALRFQADYEKRASGGPVLPGGTYTVGEEGPERLIMGAGGGGYVIPNAGGGGGKSMARPATYIYLVMPNGKVLAETVHTEDYWSSTG